MRWLAFEWLVFVGWLITGPVVWLATTEAPAAEVFVLGGLLGVGLYIVGALVRFTIWAARTAR